MKIKILILVLLTAVSMNAYAKKPGDVTLGITVSIEGDEAKRLMNSLIDKGVPFSENTTSTTSITWKNVDCTLQGSHGGGSETYSCSISL